MPLTASKRQAAALLNVSGDKIDQLLFSRRLRRLGGNRWIHITLESLAEYSKVPISQVREELRAIPARPPRKPKAISGVLALKTDQAGRPNDSKTIAEDLK